ncbi:MAG: hypothetical protein KKI09_11025 [Spirochaetes bacterium]|nr:hypothetical protein [Spirochaetota bacterium]
MNFDCADDVYAFLNRFLNFERKLDPIEYRLDRMHKLKADFGKPDECCPLFHVAGSKGKGSTATMLASIIQQRDAPAGLFTSPHLLHFTERIAIGGRPVQDDVLLPAARILADGLQGMSPESFPGGEAPTYFELLTILGFLCFRLAGCKKAVIEVGLGGRLDSTNIIKPIASLITPIELEHTEILGATIPLIAAEKAGIIKAGVPAFTSAQRPEALEVMRRKADAEQSALYILDEEMKLSDISMSRTGSTATLECKDRSLLGDPLRLQLPVIGQVQLRNAALAALAAAHAGYSRTEILAGLAASRLRARFEIIPGNPIIILDGAHTVDSVAACRRDFVELFPEGGVLLFGCAKDKKVQELAKQFGPEIKDVVLTRPGTFKESNLEAMTAAFGEQGYQAACIPETAQAINTAKDLARQRGLPLLVCGSFYLCAEVASGLLE